MCLQPPPTPLFSTWFAKHLDVIINGRAFFAAVSPVHSHRHSEGAQAIIQNLLPARCDVNRVNWIIREFRPSSSPLSSLLWELRSLIQGEVRWGWWFEAECWVRCLQPPPTPPFLDMVCQAFGCGYQRGECSLLCWAKCCQL